MINPEELAICRKRGHTLRAVSVRDKWAQCRWCGLWIRERLLLEEREDAPPEDEQSSLAKIIEDK